MSEVQTDAVSADTTPAEQTPKRRVRGYHHEMTARLGAVLLFALPFAPFPDPAGAWMLAHQFPLQVAGLVAAFLFYRFI
jgi:hypothetical protein